MEKELTLEERQQACAKEMDEVLKKYGFALTVQNNPQAVLVELAPEKSPIEVPE